MEEAASQADGRAQWRVLASELELRLVYTLPVVNRGVLTGPDRTGS